MVAQELLGAHHVPDGDKGKVAAERPAGRGVERGRTGRTLAAAEYVGAKHVKPARVDRLARSDEVVPPAGFFSVGRMDAGAVMVAAEGVADDDGVVTRGVQTAISLEAQRESRQDLAALAGEGLRADEVARLDESNLAGAGGGLRIRAVLRVSHGGKGKTLMHTNRH